MTRRDILNEYRVENGIIRSPGKFEGEMLYVPYFWEVYLGGNVDEEDGEYLIFQVEQADVEMFPELAKQKKVVLLQRDDGFVCEC